MRRTVSIIAFALLLVACSAAAQIPRTMSYQGVLRDDFGDIVEDNDYSIEFSIFDVESGGTELWTETQSVEVRDGIFNVTLGTTVNLTLAFDRDYWLEIEVAPYGELHPRTPLMTVPYAFRAAVADSVKPTAVIDDGDWEVSGTSIWHDGWVGVNTGGVLPSYPLDVYGTAQFNGRMDIGGPVYCYGDIHHWYGDFDLTDGNFTMGLGNIEAQRLDPIGYFGIGVGAAPMLFCNEANGYVGINMTSPAYQFDVDGTVNCTSFRLPTGASDGHVLTSDASGSATWQAAPSSPLKSGKFECQDNYVPLVTCNGAMLLQGGSRNVFEILSAVGDASVCYAYYLDGVLVSRSTLPGGGASYYFTVPSESTPYHAEVILSRPWAGGAIARIDIVVQNGRAGGIWHSSH